MVKSLNTEMAHTTKGTWFREGPIYGNIMVGDKASNFTMIRSCKTTFKSLGMKSLM